MKEIYTCTNMAKIIFIFAIFSAFTGQCHGFANLTETTYTVLLKTFLKSIYGTPVKPTIDTDKMLKAFATVENINIMSRDISENVENTHEMTTLTVALTELSVLFDKVDNSYGLYMKHKESNKDAKDPTLLRFAEETRNIYQGPMDYINTIHSKVVPRNLNLDTANMGYMNDISVLSLLTKHLQSYQRTCNKSKSQQQILYMLYMSMNIAEMKVYSILEFCYRKLADVGKCNYNSELALLKNHLVEKRNKSVTSFKKFMQIAAREVWRCDPKKHIEGKTYTDLKRVFQKYVINDEDISPEGNCMKTCGTFTDGGAPKRCVNKEDYYDTETNYSEHSICDQQRTCNGSLYDCTDHFSKFNELWICPSPLTSARRYEFMQHGSVDNLLGIHNIVKYGPHNKERKDCSRHMSYDYREFGESFQDIYRHCEICMCTCHDWKNPQAEQEYNVRAIVADNGYVITGARLVKENNMMNIQIQQGKIQSNGHIDEQSLQWKPIAKPRSVYDVRSLGWLDSRSVYLGLSEIPKKHVLVGLKLAQIDSKNGPSKLLAFKTLSIPYDFTTGSLTYDGTYYREPDVRNLRDPEFHVPDFKDLSLPLTKEAEVDVTDYDISINTALPSVPVPNTKKIVKFTTSNFEKDLGQSTIPFYDIQDVTTMPASPLSGISFYYKGRENFGGFIALKLTTFDLSDYIS